MIIAKFEDLHRYDSLNPLFKQAFDWMQKTDLKSLKAGKIELKGSDLFANVQEYKTKNLEEAFFEAHRTYIDIQFIIEGTENLGYAHISNLKEDEPYSLEKDFHKLKGNATQTVCLTPGTACILFPEDGHEPGLNAEDGIKKDVRKICMKVKA